MITHTIERWDGKEAARRIELHVGRDLQFIRINGTIVGGLVGVLIQRSRCWWLRPDERGPMSESVVPLRDESIRLGQFLKLADLVDTGADAKGAARAGAGAGQRRGRDAPRPAAVDGRRRGVRRPPRAGRLSRSPSLG